MMKSSSSGRSSRPIIDIDPSIIRFTHSRIRPFFTGNNFRIETTINDIVEQRTKVSDLPLITVIENGGYYFSLNNRRLYVMKYLHKNGHLESSNNTIKAYTKTALEREKKRYTISNCILEAMIMKEHHKEVGSDENSDNEAPIEALSSEIEPTIFEKISKTTEQSSKVEEAKDVLNQSNQKRSSSIPGEAHTTITNVKGKFDTKNIDKKVLDGIKRLQKLFVKNKMKPVLSQLEEWVLSGQLKEGDELDYVRMQIGFET